MFVTLQECNRMSLRLSTTMGGYNHWTGLMDWTTGLDYWTTGLDYWTHPNCKIQLVQCRTKAKLSYFLSYFTNTAPYSVFPGVLEVKGHVHI